jgi:Protein of unknown function (DUF3592)
VDVVESKIEGYLKGPKAVVLWAIFTVLAAAIAAIVFEVPKHARLLASGVEVRGGIIALQPDNHGSVIYEYETGGYSYKGAGHAGDIGANFDDLRVGQEVPVFFDPERREVSCLGEPSEHLNSLLFLTAFLASSPTLFVVALKVRKFARS